MNNVSLYLKAHVMRSSVAAVDLAKRNPSLRNIHFAEKILRIKSTNAQLKLEKNSNGHYLEIKKLNKYNFLFTKLKEVKNNHIGGYEFERNEKNTEDIKNSKAWWLANNFENKDYRYRNLIGIDFKNKDLRTANFDSSYVMSSTDEPIDVNFSGSNLSNVDLTVAHLNNLLFINSNLTGAKVKANNADYSNAKLDGAEISFNFHFHLNESSLDDSLDNPYREYSVFTTINSIDDKYYNIKISLMNQIIDKLLSLRDDEFNKLHFDSMLNNIFSKDFYLENNKIRNFTKKIYLNKINDNTKHHEKIFSNELLKNKLDFCLDVISLFDDSRYEDKHFMIERNNEFIELMALSLYHDNKSIQEKARVLYEKYLNLDEVKPFVEKEDFGNGNHKVDWSEKDYNNYILLNKNNFIVRNDNKVIIISHENLVNMLFSNDTEQDVSWTNFFLYVNGENKAIGEIDYNNLFNEDFNIFKINYNVSFNKIMYRKILPILNLGTFYKQFHSAFIGDSIGVKQKLVNVENQQKLADIFNKFLVFSNDNIKYTSLKEEHYQALCQGFDIESLNNEEKSKYLLSLATLFVKYSSSVVFGTESDSPQILRMYAYALLKKANELNVDLMNDYFNDWESRLLGENNAFPCTDILFSIMSSYVKENFNNIYNVIMPPHWR